MNDHPSFKDLPKAINSQDPESKISLIWLVPLIALILGIWIAGKSIMQSGPSVEITFLTAEGLEAGKTKIRYKNVDIGEVTSINISSDRSKILVEASFTKDAEPLLVADSRFWVEKPRITGGHISGINTLLSGAYIAIDVGSSKEPKRHFQGQETAPILISRMPGKEFVLEAKDIGSLDVGSPIYFRHIEVGEVIAHDLDASGDDVHIKFFVHAPYDRFVTTDTRFWNASGVDITLDSAGLKLETQSLSSILAGGIAFESPVNSNPPGPADAGSHFKLHKDKGEAMKTIGGNPILFELEFKESVRGLSPGAPVEFRGIAVGEVQSIDIVYDKQRKNFRFPVRVLIFPERLGSEFNEHSNNSNRRNHDLILELIDKGLRAQLRNGNLLTGQLYIAADFVTDAPKFTMDWSKDILQFPTVPGTVGELQQSVTSIMRKIDKMPLEDIGNNTRNSLANINAVTIRLDSILKKLDESPSAGSPDAVTELRETLSDVHRLLDPDAPLQTELRQTLKETTASARSIRSLADTLDNQPESIIRGKAE